MKINIASNEVIHFIGIGGIGMSGLAQIMKNMGFNIQGSDLNKNKNTALFWKAESIDTSNINNQSFKAKTSSFIESIDVHINNVLNIEFLELNKIKNKKFKIVLDTINGASCVGFKKLLKQLNCEIIHINDEPNGIFNRNPEPKQKI